MAPTLRIPYKEPAGSSSLPFHRTARLRKQTEPDASGGVSRGSGDSEGARLTEKKMEDVE